MEKITKTRDRGVLLDPNKVKLAASKIGVHSLEKLQDHYLTRLNIYDSEPKVAYKAWSERKMDIKSAKKIAEVLGVEDYSLLLLDKSTASPWQKLICNEDYEDNFVSFIDHSKSDLNLVQFNQDDHEDLPKVPLSTKWQLELKGNNAESVFIILRSEDVFFQLAPVEQYSNQFDRKKMRYPQDSGLSFDKKYGVGWRQFIVVRAKHIKQKARSHTIGYKCTIDDLDLFALTTTNILGNAIAVDTYEFMLVES